MVGLPRSRAAALLAFILLPGVAAGTALALQLRRVAEVEEPTGVAARAGDPTLYVLEKAGRIRAVRDGALDPLPRLDVSAETRTASSTERRRARCSASRRSGTITTADRSRSTETGSCT